MKNCTIFIVTFARDFPYLKYCLKSIAKFASGFNVAILVPHDDIAALEDLFIELGGFPFSVKLLHSEEWAEKGMLWHEFQIMCSEFWCPDADYIAHFDPDCVFTAPVTPDTFIKDGKPILQYEAFDTIGRRCPGVLKWKAASEACLPFPVFHETMRGHPEVYHRSLYAETRKLIQDKTGNFVEQYIQSCCNTFPQTFCEFETLGIVALYKFKDQYHPVDNGQKQNPDKSDFPVGQFWSHGAIDKPQDIWWEGRQVTITPLEKIKELGLL